MESEMIDAPDLQKEFVDEIKRRLKNWFQALPDEGAPLFYYDAKAGTLIGSKAFQPVHCAAQLAAAFVNEEFAIQFCMVSSKIRPQGDVVKQGWIPRKRGQPVLQRQGAGYLRRVDLPGEGKFSPNVPP